MANMTIKERWGNALNILLDPWVLLLIATSLLAGYMAAYQTDPKNIALMTGIAAMSSGVLGGILAKRWTDATEERLAAVRGRAAVRGLKLMLNKLHFLESRTARFLERSCAANETGGITLNDASYEEIIATCRVLQEDAIASIENWTDIVPEADLKSQIGIITDLKRDESLRVNEIESLKRQLAEGKNENENELNELKAELINKENELVRIQNEIATSRSSLGLSSVPQSVDSRYSVGGRSTKCMRCENIFIQEAKADSLGVVSWGSPFCQQCQNANTAAAIKAITEFLSKKATD